MENMNQKVREVLDGLSVTVKSLIEGKTYRVWAVPKRDDFHGGRLSYEVRFYAGGLPLEGNVAFGYVEVEDLANAVRQVLLNVSDLAEREGQFYPRYDCEENSCGGVDIGGVSFEPKEYWLGYEEPPVIRFNRICTGGGYITLSFEDDEQAQTWWDYMQAVTGTRPDDEPTEEPTEEPESGIDFDGLLQEIRKLSRMR